MQHELLANHDVLRIATPGWLSCDPIIAGERLENDEVNDHLQLATVVHIAADGRTANARGVELSVSGVKGRGAQWEEGIFENEYLKQDGIWKIRSVHYYPRIIADYELGWAKDNGACGIFMRGLECERALGAPYFYPLWEMSAALDLAVCIHSANGSVK